MFLLVPNDLITQKLSLPSLPHSLNTVSFGTLFGYLNTDVSSVTALAVATYKHDLQKHDVTVVVNRYESAPLLGVLTFMEKFRNGNRYFP
jgi:hypothetical protein